MAADWTKVTDEVLAIARELIYAYHAHLIDAQIGFVFRSKATSSKGRTVWATALKVDHKYQPFFKQDLDFMIWIAYPVWITLDSTQRQALIDHELCHLRYDDGDCSVVGHDIEEFGAILDRYGLWNFGLFKAQEQIARAVQKSLFPREGGLFAIDPAALAGNEPEEAPEPQPEPVNDSDAVDDSDAFADRAIAALLSGDDDPEPDGQDD